MFRRDGTGEQPDGVFPVAPIDLAEFVQDPFLLCAAGPVIPGVDFFHVFPLGGWTHQFLLTGKTGHLGNIFDELTIQRWVTLWMS